ncbi:MAG: LEA type 2 family protein [Bacteroidales bacterium]|nr:LEA type 2 family protein [Bacteroidales bacterium]
MKKCFGVLVAFAMMVAICGCGSVRRATAMKDCNYKFKSIGNISFMGKGQSAAMGILGVLTGFVPEEMPLDFTLYLNVENPNDSRAAVESLEYSVDVDGVEFAKGKTDTDFSVDGNSTAVLALPISTDIRRIMNTEHRKAMANVVRNMIGVKADNVSSVRVKIKPSVRIKRSTIKSPVFIPITFEYGGSKKQ